MGKLSKLDTALRSLAKKLGSIPSFAFALIYLSLVPLFAFAFWMIPSGFFHSTVQYEKSLHEDATVVLKQLQKEIIVTFKNAHSGFGATQGNWNTQITSAHLHSLEPIDNAIKFRMRVEFWGVGEKNKGIQHSMNLIIKLPDSPYFNSLDPKTDKWTFFRFPEIENGSQLPTDARILFPYRYNNYSDDLQGIVIPLSLKTHNKLKAFSLTSKGFPTQSTGSYARMFYFSAVTITTLGYGDIVPITTYARLLVAIESILGIVFIGLFLNSLARESGDNQS